MHVDRRSEEALLEAGEQVRLGCDRGRRFPWQRARLPHRSVARGVQPAGEGGDGACSHREDDCRRASECGAQTEGALGQGADRGLKVQTDATEEGAHHLPRTGAPLARAAHTSQQPRFKRSQ